MPSGITRTNSKPRSDVGHRSGASSSANTNIGCIGCWAGHLQRQCGDWGLDHLVQSTWQSKRTIDAYWLQVACRPVPPNHPMTIALETSAWAGKP